MQARGRGGVRPPTLRLPTLGPKIPRATTLAATLATVLSVSACDSEPVGPLADTDFVIAFVSSRDGNDEIYGYTLDGQLINLTTHTENDRAPVWSPDGRRIAFTRQSTNVREVMVLDLQRGTIDNVSTHTDADDFEPAWSPDGTRLAFTSNRDGDDEIYVVRADGRSLQNVTNDPGPDRDPAWSPDGTLIAFSSGRGLNAAIFRMRSDGSDPRRITSGTVGDETEPRFDPTGVFIAFESTRDGASDVAIIDALSGTPLDEFRTDPSHDMWPRWSPDGQQVLFLSNREGSLWDVWTMARDGTGAAKITGFPGQRDAGPSWSPDGTEIAFESRIEGNWDVYISSADGSQVRAITTDPSNDGSVAWRPGR
jgi:tol-pal system beta propeller repeat protein TolB